MNGTQLEEAFRQVRPLYEALGLAVERALTPAIKSAGINDAVITSRPKGVDEFLKKTVRKTYADPMAEITDKVGVRVVVSLLAHVPLIEAVITSQFTVIERLDKSEELGDDQLGYLGLHFLIVADAGLNTDDFDMDGHICEIQVHTRSQNAWASVSHPLTYKAGGVGPSSSVRRRINRLVALVELFDQEVDAARSQVMHDQDVPEVAMLDALDRPFTVLIGRSYDAALSLHILHVLREAFSEEELARFPALIADFAAEHGQYFADRVNHELEGTSVDPLLTQPEALVVLERLEHARAKLRATWDSHLEPILLTRLSESLGRPLQPA